MTALLKFLQELCKKTKNFKKSIDFSRNAWYNVITVKEGGDKVIELITSIANLTSSLLALITAIIAYKLAKEK